MAVNQIDVEKHLIEHQILYGNLRNDFIPYEDAVKDVDLGGLNLITTGSLIGDKYDNAVIDHNELYNYEANRHIDWTNASATFYNNGGVECTGTLKGGTLELTGQSSDVDFNGNKLTSVGDPTGSQDASTKNYTDNNDFWNRVGSVIIPQSGTDTISGLALGVVDITCENVATKEGTIEKVPVNNNDIVNKEYVDAAVSGGLQLFLTEDAVADIATYMQMVPTPTGAAEENTVTAITGTAGTLMEEYATVLNCPCVLNLASIPEGVVTLHLHAKGEAANKMSFYVEFYKRDSGGTETLITTSEDSNLLTTTSASYVVHANVTEEVTWTSTDRVVIKIYGKNLLVAAKDLTIYVEGDTASRFELSGNVPVGNNVTASAVLTDDAIVTGEGGARGVQDTSLKIDAGNLVYTNTLEIIKSDTADGSDTKALALTAGDTIGYTRGGAIIMYGNENTISNGGVVILTGDDATDSNVYIQTNNSTRVTINYDGTTSFNNNKIVDITDPTSDQDGATKKYVDDNVFPDQANAYPQRATIWGDELIVTAGNARVTVLNTGQLYNFFNWLPLADANDGDAFSSSFFLKAGTYDFYVLGLTGTQRGIIDWAVDGTDIVTGQDWYNGSTVFNAVKKATAITITGSGYHKLTGTINGKHASSSDYTMPLTKLWFSPATDPVRT